MHAPLRERRPPSYLYLLNRDHVAAPGIVALAGHGRSCCSGSAVGATCTSDDHAQAVAELKAASPAGAAVAPTLSRLLKLKAKSQYQEASLAPTDAAKAIEWASRLVLAAEVVVSVR